MEKITINAEFLFELKSKDQWVRRVPQILPEKTRSGEKLIWLDSVGNVFESGRDFEEAEKLATYPCKVYRPYNVGGFTPQLSIDPKLSKKEYNRFPDEGTHDGKVYTTNHSSECGLQPSEPKGIDFIMWYSGMEREKIIKAYHRYLKEKEPKDFFDLEKEHRNGC